MVLHAIETNIHSLNVQLLLFFGSNDFICFIYSIWDGHNAPKFSNWYLAGYGLSKVKAKYTERNREEKKTYNTKQTSKYLHTFRFFFPVWKQQITFIRNEYELKNVKTQIQFKFTLGIQFFFSLFCCGLFKFQSYTRTNMDRVWSKRYWPKCKRLNTVVYLCVYCCFFFFCRILPASHAFYCCIFATAKCAANSE